MNPTPGRARSRFVGLPLVLVMAALLRLAALGSFPDLTTEDSGDYLAAAHHLATGGGLDHPRIGSWRAPGYVVFMAGLRHLAGADTLALLLAQGVLGLATVAAGWILGERLAGRRGALLLSLFFACHPGYLLFEHCVQPETLGLTLLVVGTTLAVLAPTRPSSGLAVATGLVLAAALLSRPNAQAFVGLLCAGLFSWWQTRNPRAAWRWGLAAALGLATLTVPWMVRQQLAFGEAGITLNLERNRLIYLAQHEGFEAFRAGAAAAAWVPGRVDSIFDVVAGLGEDPAEAEAHALRLMAQQLAGRGGLILGKRLLATATFAGIPDYEPPAAGRHDLLFWFRHFVRNPGALRELRLDHPLPEYLLHDRLLPDHASAANAAWATAGELTLRFGRPLVLLAALALTLRRLGTGRSLEAAEWTVGVLFAGQLATAVVHGWFLADYDRFAVLFDWVPLAVVATLAHRVPSPRPNA